jgi:hypothetical protein
MMVLFLVWQSKDFSEYYIEDYCFFNNYKEAIEYIKEKERKHTGLFLYNKRDIYRII